MDIPLTELNQSELLERVYIHRGFRLRRITEPARLIHLLENPQAQPLSQELPTETMDTRARLEKWILKNWDAIQSQIPCKAANRGHCTIYPCTELRHLTCWEKAKKQVGI